MKHTNVFSREYEELHRPIDKVIARVFSSGSFILGKEVEGFEKDFARYLGVKHVVCVGNGLEALQIGMMASGIKKGDEIITTSLSAVATTIAITLLGAIPVFVDIDEYFELDVSSLEKSITKRTRAILPVHLYGQSVDMDEITKIATKYDLMIFEDACQGHGACYDGKKLGTIGSFGAFSFYPTKNLSCYGDGGAIATNDDSLALKCRMLRNYGQKDRYIHEYQGINSRMDEVQASILRVKLPHLDIWNAKRQKIAAYYDSNLTVVGDIEIPKKRDNATHVYHQYVIRTKKRDLLLKRLHTHSIPALIHYPVPIHKQPCYKEFNKFYLPRVENACQELLSLPIHPYMLENEVVNITEIIKKFHF